MTAQRSHLLRFITNSPPVARVQRASLSYVVGSIQRRAEALQRLTDQQLELRARELAWELRGKSRIDNFLVPGFSLISELMRRRYQITPHFVQIQGGLVMARGGIAEMQTGEGKTLTALFPIVLRALQGSGCHVLTVNDYLASRDADFARPLFATFGLSVATLTQDVPRADRARCYAADVTYGTEKQFGFDYLKDQLEEDHGGLAGDPDRANWNSSASSKIVQRRRHFALVDEADSLMIDQARTPLVISLPQPITTAERLFYNWCCRASSQLAPRIDYRFDVPTRSARLTPAGCRRLAGIPRPPELSAWNLERLSNQIERALMAREGFLHERDFLIVEGKVEIVDEGTGRVLPGRKWRDGLQQAIEVQAGVEVTETTGTAARITLQNYLAGYPHLCGMTGTATGIQKELLRVYGTPVSPIPTHQPCRRRMEGTRIFRTLATKMQAVVAEIRDCLQAGRAVLVGTASVAASEHCAELLRSHGLEAALLHARHHAQEATIIRSAGQAAQVTVATNMAGRGTDIKISESVRNAGGLHVISTEMNRSARIDRQLMGRTARQGDPGSCRMFVSLEDSLLEILGAERVRRFQAQAARSSKDELSVGWLRHFQCAQRRFERQDARARKTLLREEKHRLRRLNELGFKPAIDLLFEADA